MKRAAKILLLVLFVVQAIGIALLVASCGGGDPEPEQTPTPGVNCQTKPEACK